MNSIVITKTKIRIASISLSLLIVQAHAAHQDELPEIIVPGHTTQGFTHLNVEPDKSGLSGPDAAGLMGQVPGGSVNNNGPISGQTQYRGMYGPRMNVRLDGMYVNSGGPNWMDPPLHYIPIPLLDSLEVTRGIGSVSNGTGIGGNIRTSYKSSQFTHSGEFELHGQLSIRGHDADDGYNLGAMVSASNNRQRMHLLGSRDAGGEREFAAGHIAASEYERNFFGVGYGIDSGGHEFSFDYRYNDTGDSGNPVLPLDIEFLKTDLFRAGYKGALGDFDITAQVDYSNIDHRMSNFRLRPPPDFSSLPLAPFVGTDRRFVVADSNGVGFRLDISRPAGNGMVSAGVDGHLAEHNAMVADPDAPMFYVTNFERSVIDRYGLYAEWRGAITGNLILEFGLRYDRVVMETGVIDAQPANLPMASMPGTPAFAVRMLRDRFNAADREQADNNFDWVIKVGYDLTETAAIELGLARKSRSPGYIERYSWIPLEVNAGLGDGNNYIGNTELKPEVSHQLELGLDWRTGRFHFSPRGYYRRIDDYIQGMPVADMVVRAVSGNANGDPNPLQFANVEAEIYGADAVYGLRINQQWRIDGVLSYTRGRRRDIDDDLYRIAPLNTRASLNYETGGWSATVEGVIYARQENISDTITSNSAIGDSAETPGYGLLNIYGHYVFPDGSFAVNGGVENLLDREYIDHLSGFNRVVGGVAPLGRRLPGGGRNLFVSVSYRW